MVYPKEDAALRLRILTRQVREVAARVAEQVERARAAREASEYALQERVRYKGVGGAK